MEVYATIDLIRNKFRQDRKTNNYLGLVEDGLALLEEVPKLIDISIVQESEYRKFKAALSDERDENGKRFSDAFCESKAKATDYYKEWQKARQIQELIIELVNMSKILARGINSEFNAR